MIQYCMIFLIIVNIFLQNNSYLLFQNSQSIKSHFSKDKYVQALMLKNRRILDICQDFII